jgi:hypothetical protein
MDDAEFKKELEKLCDLWGRGCDCPNGHGPGILMTNLSSTSYVCPKGCEYEADQPGKCQSCGTPLNQDTRPTGIGFCLCPVCNLAYPPD